MTERERQEAQRQHDLEALYPGYEATQATPQEGLQAGYTAVRGRVSG